MALISYLEIESLRLDLQTKKILKKIKSQVSCTSQNTQKNNNNNNNNNNPETQQSDESEKESDQIGEATCP